MTWRVSLPMYNLPEMRADNAAFWAALRAELAAGGVTDVPEELEFTRAPVPAAIEEDVLLTQVCGYPLQTIYAGQAEILGAPVYDVAHCAGTTHAGVFIVAAGSRFKTLEDLKGCHFVYNSRHSNSGMNLPRRALAEIGARAPYFASIAETHSQPGNIERVARGEAEATCVDNVTYAFVCRHRPAIGSATRVLAVTPSSPSIPFVTSVAMRAPLKAALRQALHGVATKPEWANVRAALLLRTVEPLALEAYEVQLAYEREAAEMGYPALA